MLKPSSRKSSQIVPKDKDSHSESTYIQRECTTVCDSPTQSELCLKLATFLQDAWGQTGQLVHFLIYKMNKMIIYPALTGAELVIYYRVC